MKAVLLLLATLIALLPTAYAVAFVPIAWLLERVLLEGGDPFVTAGPVILSASDCVIVVLFGRLLFEIVRTREIAADRQLYLAVTAYLGINLLACLAAGVKFGQDHLLGCLISWLRLVACMLLVPISAQAVKTLPQARRCLCILFGTLAVLAAIQYVNFFGASHGIVIGEVQGLERGEVRYFGPVGDSVGFVLLLGYLLTLCFGSLVGAAAFLGAILLTAGIGAIFATALGSGLVLLAARHAPALGAALRRCVWFAPVVLLAGVVLGMAFARPLIGPLLNRVGTGGYADSGSQRLDSARMAGVMIVDNPLLGVGYMGYQRALEHYGGERFFNLSKTDGASANANNQVLQSLTDSGLPGLAAFVLIIFCMGRCFLRIAAHREEPFFSTFYLGAFLWLLTLFFGDLAAVWLLPSFGELVLWIFLGVSVALPRLLDEQAADQSPLPSPVTAETNLALA